MGKIATASIAGLLLMAGGAQAHHPVLRSAVRAIVGVDRIDVRIVSSLEEPVAALGLSPGPDGRFDPEQLRRAVRDHAAYVERHFELSADGSPLRASKVQAAPASPLDRPLSRLELQRSHAVYGLAYPIPSRPPPRELAFVQSMLREISYAPDCP